MWFCDLGTVLENFEVRTAISGGSNQEMGAGVDPGLHPFICDAAGPAVVPLSLLQTRPVPCSLHYLD